MHDLSNRLSSLPVVIFYFFYYLVDSTYNLIDHTCIELLFPVACIQVYPVKELQLAQSCSWWPSMYPYIQTSSIMEASACTKEKVWCIILLWSIASSSSPSSPLPSSSSLFFFLCFSLAHLPIFLIFLSSSSCASFSSYVCFSSSSPALSSSSYVFLHMFLPSRASLFLFFLSSSSCASFSSYFCSVISPLLFFPRMIFLHMLLPSSSFSRISFKRDHCRTAWYGSSINFI